MGTGWIELITDYAMVEIDDDRLRDEAQADPALFFRRMALYVQNGVSLFTKPPEVQQQITLGLTPPTYGEYYWTSDVASLSAETVVNTGLTGYDLFSCAVYTVDGTGSVTLIPYTSAVYDAENGSVTFPRQSAEGVRYEMDFYNDGEFPVVLTARQKRILALCIARVWFERFSNNWLNMQPKLQDASFTLGSESGHMNAATSRKRETWSALNDEMDKYAQDCAYMTAKSRSQTLMLL